MATAKNAPRKAAAAATPATKPEGGDKPQALKVVPKRAGFRRAGYAFPDGETVIPLDELSEKQYAQLTTEPMLVTHLVDLPADEAGTGT